MKLLALSPVRMVGVAIFAVAAALIPVAVGIAGSPGVSHARLVSDTFKRSDRFVIYCL